jgi:ribosome-binding ATPase
MKIGLVGLPGSGKSTVFNALTGMSVETGFGSRPDKAHIGSVKVPDHRVDRLAELYSPKKVTYAEVTFTDVGGGQAQGIDRKVLSSMREVDALCQVLRAFPDPLGEPGHPLSELEELEAETILADLEIVERRVERLAKDRSNPRELELLTRVKDALEAETPLRNLELSGDELKQLSGYRMLTLKPMLLVVNVDEGRAAEPAPADVAEAATRRGLGVVVLSAQVEMDIAQMERPDQDEFLASLGLDAPAAHRFIRAAFELLDLITMLTAGPDECRAWPIPRGATAPRAAGKIHSDLERGFIRAEVIHWEDLIKAGSEAKCRERGLLRVEGKEYVVQDGDVVNIRFNV